MGVREEGVISRRLWPGELLCKCSSNFHEHVTDASFCTSVQIWIWSSLNPPVCAVLWRRPRIDKYGRLRDGCVFASVSVER